MLRTTASPPTFRLGLPWPHLLLALAVVGVWGSNFVVVRVGLDQLPPLLFATLRFALAALPWVLFVKRPRVSWWQLAGYGVVVGCGQFGLLFIAMRADISPGLASLVMQSQAFFTVALAAALLGEHLARLQVLAMLLAGAGLAITLLAADSSATPLGLLLTLAAALAWAVANLIVKAAGRVDALGFVVWSSVFSTLSLLGLTLALEGAPAALAAVRQATSVAWLAVLWQALANTLFGYGIWSWLLARHPAALIAPLSLLVPVFGMAASAVLLAEPMPAWKVAAAVLIVGGLCVNLRAPWPRTVRMWRRESSAARPPAHPGSRARLNARGNSIQDPIPQAVPRVQEHPEGK
jgi:O-acetylserine/cysteine efflux transporter